MNIEGYHDIDGEDMRGQIMSNEETVEDIDDTMQELLFVQTLADDEIEIDFEKIEPIPENRFDSVLESLTNIISDFKTKKSSFEFENPDKKYVNKELKKEIKTKYYQVRKHFLDHLSNKLDMNLVDLFKEEKKFYRSDIKFSYKKANDMEMRAYAKVYSTDFEELFEEPVKFEAALKSSQDNVKNFSEPRFKKFKLEDIMYRRGPGSPNLYIPPYKRYNLKEKLLGMKTGYFLSEKDDKKYKFKISTSGSYMPMASMWMNDVNFELELNDDAVRIIRHELVASCFSGKLFDTDKRISTIGNYDDGLGNLTPDMIYQRQDGTWVVVEFATTESLDMEKMYYLKMTRYQRALENRANNTRKIDFYIVICSQKQVLTNINFGILDYHSQNYALRSLFLAYKLGELISNLAVRMGYKPLDDEETERVCSRLDSSIENCNKIFEDVVPEEEPKAGVLSKRLFRSISQRVQEVDIDKEIDNYSRKINKKSAESIAKVMKEGNNTEKIRKECKQESQINGKFDPELMVYNLTRSMKKQFAGARTLSVEEISTGGQIDEANYETIGGDTYIDKITKKSNKAVVQIPMLYPKVVQLPVSFGEFKFNGTDYLSKMWSSAVPTMWRMNVNSGEDENSYLTQEGMEKFDKMLKLIGDVDNLLLPGSSEDIKQINNVIMGVEPFEDKTKIKQNFNRVDIVGLNQDDLENMALQGVGGKKFKDSLMSKETKKDSQQPQSINVDCSDIEHFMNMRMPELLTKTSQSNDTKENHWVEELRKSANGILKEKLGVNESMMTTDFMEHFSRSKLGMCMKTVRLIMEELNFSLKQFTGNLIKRWVIKKLPGMNVYIMTRSTGLTNHVFYTVAAHRDSIGYEKMPFKEPSLITDNWYVWDFLSSDRHRISNLLTVDSQVCSLMGLMSVLWKLNNSDIFVKADNKFCRTIGMMILTLMEDKQQTSTNLQIFRYIYMKCITDNKMTFDPITPFNKLDKRPKSRLLVHQYNLMFKAVAKMIINKPYPIYLKDFSKVSSDLADLEEETKKQLSADKFENLYNWVTNEKEEQFSVMVNFCYLGILHNKDEADELTGYLKIFSKIVKEELLMRKVDMRYTGYEPKPDLDYKSHEFDPVFMIAASKLQKKKFDIQFGNYEARFERRFRTKIMKRTTESLATYKVSANMPIKNKDYQKFYTNLDQIVSDGIAEGKNKFSTDISTKRNKVLYNIYQLLLKDVIDNYPISQIDKVLRALISDGGSHFDLFKKQQIGGMREILVMTILTRLAVDFLESVSGVVAEDQVNEMMTKGTEKIKLTEQYIHEVYYELLKNKDSVAVQNIDSLDCQTWCQQFIMSGFYCALAGVVPERYSKVLYTILYLHSTKKLILPEKLLQKWREKIDVKSYDPAMNELKDQYLGRSKFQDLVKPREILMNNVSNMGQGVIGTTSSVLHANHAAFLLEIERHTLKQLKLMKKIGDYRYFALQKVSSDDSSIRRNLIINEFEGMNKSQVKEVGRTILSIFSKNVETSAQLSLMRISKEKSTPDVRVEIEEFNSIWIIGNTTAMVPIKFSIAALRPVPMSKLEDRLHSYSNLRSQMLESGCGHYLVDLVQNLQLNIHYRYLGSDHNKFFPLYAKLLLLIKNPAFGYFPLEPSYTCGIGGSAHAIYNTLRYSEEARASNTAMFINNQFELTDSGKPTLSLSLFLGEGERYRDFLKKLRIPENWDHISYVDPNMMLRNSYGKQETVFKLQKKSLTPSSADSFSFASLNKLAASALYTISHPAVFKRTKDPTAKDKLTKTSLIREALLNYRFSVKAKNREVEYEPYSEFSEVYELINNENKGFTSVTLLPDVIVRSNRKVDLWFPQLENIAMVPLSDVIREIWFGKRSRFSRTQVREATLAYQVKFPWIKESFVDSLLDCPFPNPASMLDFIKSMAPKQRTVFVNCSVSRGLTFRDTIKKMSKYNYVPGFIAVPNMQNEISKRYETDFTELNNRALLLLSGPKSFSETYSEDVARSIMGYKKLIDYNNVIDYNSSSAQKSQLSLIQEWLSLVEEDMSKNNSLKFSDFTSKVREGKLSVESKKRFFLKLEKVRQGNYVFWEKEQYQRNGVWLGSGVLFGIIDGQPFRLFIEDKTITRIIITAENTISMYSKYFLYLFRELRCDGENFGVTQVRVDLKTGKMYNGNTGPVVLISRELREQIDPSNIDLYFQCTQDRISLETNIRNNSFPAVKYEPQIWNFSMDTRKDTSENGKSIMFCWDNYISCDPESLKSTVRFESSDMSSEAQNKKVDWLRETFKARVLFMQGKDPAKLKDRERYIKAMFAEENITSVSGLDPEAILDNLNSGLVSSSMQFENNSKGGSMNVSETEENSDFDFSFMNDDGPDFLGDALSQLLSGELNIYGVEGEANVEDFSMDIFGGELENENSLVKMLGYEVQSPSMRVPRVAATHPLWDILIKLSISIDQKRMMFVNELMYSDTKVTYYPEDLGYVALLFNNEAKPTKNEEILIRSDLGARW